MSFERFGVSAPFDPNFCYVTSPIFSPTVLGSIRLLFAVYALVTTIITLVYTVVVYKLGDSYLSYFTHLSYIGLLAYFFAAGVQTIAFALSGRKRYPLQSWPRILQLLHVLLHASVIVLPLIVTCVYWSLLADASTFDTAYDRWANVSQHAMNTVFALFEIFLTHAGPSPWMHLAPLVLVLVLYLAVAYITYASQGIYTYGFLDPKTEGALLAAYILGIALGCCVFFSIVKGVCHLRRRTCHRYGWIRNDFEQEGLGEWQDVTETKDVDA